MAAAGAAMAAASPRVSALSFDTQRRLPYNPHFTRPKTLKPPKTPLSVSLAPNPNLDVAELLKRKTHQSNREELDELYLGCDMWMPSAPKVEKPRSVYNAASLAYIGDCVYELYARRHFLFPPLSIEEYNDRVMAVVRCEAQDALLHKLLDEDFLSRDEREILRWGKNVGSSSKTRSRRRAGVAVYNRASSLETLIGFLYLTNAKRLEKVMLKLGFLPGASSELIFKETDKVGTCV